MQRSPQAIVEAIASRRAQAGVQRQVIVGLLGRGIGPSRSPFMHEAEGRRLGLDYTYALIDFDAEGLGDEQLGEIIAAAEAARFAGVNVTHPFKQRVIAHTTALSAEAEAIGAVNTVIFGKGARIGYNTDSWGFSESFRNGLAGATLGSAILLGAGGGGAAVAHAMLGLGLKRLAIFDPETPKARALAERLAVLFGRPVDAASQSDLEALSVDGLINASPIGMRKYPGLPLALDRLAPHQWVADIVYFPPDTELLQRARARGCATLGGTGMAVFQAARAFEHFTGIAPDLRSMARHFEAAA